MGSFEEFALLSQAVGYAATALAHVAAGGGRAVLVKEIAQAADIPAPYLAKIIQSLARNNLVNTQRGIGGGVTLSREATAITLFDICVALDDPCVQPRCMLGVSECNEERACPCHGFWSTHRAETTAFLQKTTIADMALFETRRRWKITASSNPPVPATLTVSQSREAAPKAP